MAVEEQVLQLEVAVDDLLLMRVPYARDELSEELARVLLLEIAMGEDVVKELAARGVFEDDADILVRLDNVVQTDNIRVFEVLPARLRDVLSGEKV
jgi:hypothetical protein